MSGWMAALPMYNVGDEVTGLYRLWLERILARLVQRGFREPVSLAEPDDSLLDWWQRDDLLLSQTCGYPLMTQLRERVVPLAIPAYRYAGCQSGFYRSALLVPAESPIRQLSDARGQRVVANQPDSHSGMNALRAAVAPLAEDGRFFGSVTWSGSHIASVEALLAGSADLAAIDAVTHAYLLRQRPDLKTALRRIGWTAPAPGLPLIAGRRVPPQWRSVLTGLIVASSQQDRVILDALGIGRFVPCHWRDYRTILSLEASAQQHGYPELA